MLYPTVSASELEYSSQRRNTDVGFASAVKFSIFPVLDSIVAE